MSAAKANAEKATLLHLVELSNNSTERLLLWEAKAPQDITILMKVAEPLRLQELEKNLASEVNASWKEHVKGKVTELVKALPQTSLKVPVVQQLADMRDKEQEEDPILLMLLLVHSHSSHPGISMKVLVLVLSNTGNTSDLQVDMLPALATKQKRKQGRPRKV